MKSIGMCWAFGLILALVPSVGAREFTDDQGRKIQAEIQSVRPPNVVLSRDGKTFVFPVAKLSEGDQAFIKKWMVDNPDIKLDFRYTKQKVGSAGGPKKKTEDWRFEVTVLNRGLSDIEGLTIQYTIFKQLHDRYAGSGPKKRLSGAVKGKADITLISAQRSFVLNTKAIRCGKVNSVTETDTTKTFERWNESLIGIKIKVSRKGKVVDEQSYGVVD